MSIAEQIAVCECHSRRWLGHEGWTNRLNHCDLIYPSLTDEALWVSASKAGVLIDEGRERCLSVEAG